MNGIGYRRSSCSSGWRGEFPKAIALAIVLATGGVGNRADAGERSARIHRGKLGYSIPYLGPVDESGRRWKRIRVEDSDLAFRAAGGGYAAISSHCDEPQLDLRILARQLLVGLQDRVERGTEAFPFAGGAAFSQVVEAVAEEKPVYAKTVTWLRGGCVVDWILVTASPISAFEPIFDSWWRGFDPGTMPAGSVPETSEFETGDPS